MEERKIIFEDKEVVVVDLWPSPAPPTKEERSGFYNLKLT